MNYKLFGFAAVAALMCSGCSQDVTEDVEKPGKEYTLVIIPDKEIGAFDSEGSGTTRTYWDEDTESVKWIGNEYMYLLVKNDYRLIGCDNGKYSFNYNRGVVGEALFQPNVPVVLTGIIPEELYKYRNITNRSQAPEKITLALPSVQESTTTTFDPWLDIMVGSKEIVYTEEEIEKNYRYEVGMPFVRVMAISKYSFPISHEKLSADEVVESVTLTAIPAEGHEPILLTGSYNLNISGIPAICINDAGEKINLRTPFMSGSASVSTTYAEDARPTLGELAFWPITAPVKLEAGDQLRFRIVTNKHEINKTITATKEVYFYNNKLNRATVKLDADTQVHAFDEAIDLSADGTANSYIVNKPRSNYKFRADVKGNGVPRDLSYKTEYGNQNGTFAYTAEDLKIEPKAAVILWYNCMQLDRGSWLRDCPIVIESVKLVGNYIEFSTPETFVNGNVVIAVIDQNLKPEEIEVDPTTRQFTNTNILWSWDLIVSDGYDPNDATQQYTKGGYTFMTRDLGAVADVNNAGKSGYQKASAQGNMYQWGRKDPFPHSPDYASNDITYMTGLWFTPTFTTIPQLEIEGEIGSYGKVDGQVFGNSTDLLVTYIGDEVGDKQYSNEVAIDYSTRAPYRWFKQSATGDDQQHRWIREFANGTAFWGNPDGEMEIKTIYDPCPAGWKIPSVKAWNALTDDTALEGTISDFYFNFAGITYPVWIGRDTNGTAGNYTIGGGSGYVIKARYMTSNVQEFYGIMPTYFTFSARKGNYDKNPEAYCEGFSRGYSALGSRIRCVKE